jgi:phage terminase large subunit-like protein
MSQPQTNPALARAIVDALENSWRARARPSQLAPPGDCATWLILAGRGFGKTRAGAEWITEQARSGRAKHIGIIGPTVDAVRDIQIEGEAGVLACAPSWCQASYEPSKRKITWANGATAITYSADRPNRLRGPLCDCTWADELASWRDMAAWDMATFCLRLGPNPPASPQRLDPFRSSESW